MRCCYTLRTAQSILCCVTHTHTLTLILIYTVNIQILPCRHSFMYGHFFPLLSDCDLVSVHSSTLWLHSGSPGTPQFHSQYVLQPHCTLLQNYCVFFFWMFLFCICLCVRSSFGQTVSALCVCTNVFLCVRFVNLFYKVFLAFLLGLHVPAGFSSPLFLAFVPSLPLLFSSFPPPVSAVHLKGH